MSQPSAESPNLALNMAACPSPRCIDSVFALAQSRVRALIESNPDFSPLYTADGRWDHGGPSWTRWGDGYFAGQMWLFHQRTQDPWWRNQAEHYSALFADERFNRDSQSMWSLFWPSWKPWYDSTGDPHIYQGLLDAGHNLVHRYINSAGYLHSFIGRHSNLIDNMLTVGMLFYVGQQTNAPRLTEMASRHCLSVRRHMVRGDGSIAHEGTFDPETGAFLGHDTQQGWRPDSSWARGQAWAMLGFCQAYCYTSDLRFLETACHCADFFIQRTGDRLIPPNDWEEPDPAMPYESAAAAAGAGGLIQLADILGRGLRASGYREYAGRVLARLCTSEFVPFNEPTWQGVLKQGIYHERKKLGVDESGVWGDYFFLDALQRFESHCEQRPIARHRSRPDEQLDSNVAMPKLSRQNAPRISPYTEAEPTL